jgi:hypothetical protein
MQAEEALAASEVPVGCVFVRDGMVIARARNRTNELRNVLSHHDLNKHQYTDIWLRYSPLDMPSLRLSIPSLPTLL